MFCGRGLSGPSTVILDTDCRLADDRLLAAAQRADTRCRPVCLSALWAHSPRLARRVLAGSTAGRRTVRVVNRLIDGHEKSFWAC